MVEPFFTTEYVNSIRDMIQQTVDGQLENLIKQGEKSKPVDIVEHFALPVPTRVSFPYLQCFRRVEGKICN